MPQCKMYHLMVTKLNGCGYPAPEGLSSFIIFLLLCCMHLDLIHVQKMEKILACIEFIPIISYLPVLFQGRFFKIFFISHWLMSCFQHILAVGSEPILRRYNINGKALSKIQCAPQSTFSVSFHSSGVGSTFNLPSSVLLE